MIVIGFLLGVGAAALLTLLFGVYSVGPTERGVMTTFGRAERLTGTVADDPQSGALLTEEEKGRYNYPNIRVIQPGGPYFKWPWQRLHKVDMTIQAVDITWDPEIRQEFIEAVTKDNLTVQISGQIRWKPCERNLYAYLFGVANPAAHVVGFSFPHCVTGSRLFMAITPKGRWKGCRSMICAAIFRSSTGTWKMPAARRRHAMESSSTPH